jgi:2-polyprenyl-6-methoxyphenol hydroxylase-like FAD-dependent oxidoreductase
VTDTAVVIAGAGLVGSAFAVECGFRGIDCLVVDPRAKTSGYEVTHPRAKLTNIRSMTHLRRWGIASKLRELDPLPRDWPMRVLYTTSVTGEPLGAFEEAFGGKVGADERFPERAQWIPQPLVEQLLRARAAELPSVELRLGRGVAKWREDEDGVAVELDDGTTVRARDLVGCDGRHSTVRETLGVALDGRDRVLRGLGLVVRLREPLPDVPRAIQYWCIQPDWPSMGGPLDDRGHWFVQTAIPADLQPGDAPVGDIVRGFFGRDVDHDVLDVALWEADAMIAERYRIGNVFLAGDAAHVHPPLGGHGMNLGIGDAVDLGWKLQAALDGWAGDALLDTYELERRDAARRVVGAAMLNMRASDATPPVNGNRRQLAELIGSAKEPEFRSLGLVLGLRYEGSPIVAREAAPPPIEETCSYVPTARPGGLAPHAWLADGSSLYDRFGRGFTLLRLGAALDTSTLERAAVHAGLPLAVVDVEEPHVADLYEAPLAFVRPDQHVAWRGDETPADPAALIDLVRGAVQ